MAGLENILPLIYHESQQPGSLLCAQHALNSLLRTFIVTLTSNQACSRYSNLSEGSYFTAPDLSELARHLDQLEQSFNQDIREHTSANMDDTGFFSVQVLENALHVWGLSIIRWRSEAMKLHHTRPHAQLAFVLNQNQHWYTLRRFGSSEENGHWFNLDSTKPSPQWISKTYLGMFLQQAEREGYSIFVVVPIDPSNAHPLPRCDADDAASTLPERSPALSEPGFEDEDMDLQAALQASLAGAEQGSTSSTSGSFSRLDNYSSPVFPSSRTFPGFPPGLASSARDNASGGPLDHNPSGNSDGDPVTASLERNRTIMARMRREQEVALREQYEEEVARFDQEQERYSSQRQEAEEENGDELFRRAMEESLAEHRARTCDNVEMRNDEDYDVPAATPAAHTMERVYDDDDAELQAALKASLETMPPGFTLPPRAPPPPPQRLTNEPAATEKSASPAVDESETETDIGTGTETDVEATSSQSAQALTREQVSIEEIRRRRLAKFGG